MAERIKTIKGSVFLMIFVITVVIICSGNSVNAGKKTILNAKKLIINVGSSKTLKLNNLSKNGKKIIWKASKPSVIKLSLLNKTVVRVTGKKAGNSKITVTYSNGAKKKKLVCSVVVNSCNLKPSLPPEPSVHSNPTIQPSRVPVTATPITLVPDNTVGYELNKIQVGADQYNYHYSFKNLCAARAWFNNSSSKESCEGRFKNMIELYKSRNYLVVPSCDNTELSGVSIDSNTNFINYAFSKSSIRVVIEPMFSEANSKYSGYDVVSYYEDKNNVKLGDKPVRVEKPDSLIDTPDDYAYYIHYYSIENVEMKSGTVKCVMDTSTNKKESTEHILTFLCEDMIVKILFNDSGNNLFDINQLKLLSFDKINLQ